MVATTKNLYTHNSSSPVVLLQQLALQYDALLEYHIKFISHGVNVKAWKAQIMWNGQTLANSICNERATALSKAGDIALSNIQRSYLIKYRQLSIQTQQIAPGKQDTKLDSFGHELDEYIEAQNHRNNKNSVISTKSCEHVQNFAGKDANENMKGITTSGSTAFLDEKSSNVSPQVTVSTQTENYPQSCDKIKGCIPAVVGMNRVRSYVEIKFAEQQVSARLNDGKQYISDSSTSGDDEEDEDEIVGLLGWFRRLTVPYLCINTTRSGSMFVTST